MRPHANAAFLFSNAEFMILATGNVGLAAKIVSKEPAV